jgi:hypothetical protein
VTFGDLRTAAGHTLLLARMRWRMVRTTGARVSMFVGLLVLFAMLYGASNIGQIIIYIAETDGGRTAAGIFAQQYITAFTRGDFGSLAAVALGSALAASLFSPLTGAANLSLASPEDLSTLRLHRLHRYFDSVTLQAFSTIGLLQMLALTTVASLLTLDGEGRGYALLLSWAAWGVLVPLTVAEAWAIEITYRKYGIRTRRVLGAIVLLAISVAIIVDPRHGTTLFGFGELYAALLQGEAGAPWWLPFAVAAGMASVVIVGGLRLCQVALGYQAVPTAAKGERRARALSKSEPVMLAQILLRQMWRTQEVARPVFVIVFLGIPAAWFTRGSETAMLTMVIAIPLAVALAWTVNVFGIIGPGMTWLGSQPNTLRRMLDLAFAVHISVSMGISLLVWVPPTLVGWVSAEDAGQVLAGTLVATVLVGRSALRKSVFRPYLARLGNRGDTVVPPLTAVNYTLRFALWSGQIGILTFVQDDVVLRWGIALVAIAWALFRFLLLRRQWADRARQARIVATVSAG